MDDNKKKKPDPKLEKPEAAAKAEEAINGLNIMDMFNKVLDDRENKKLMAREKELPVNIKNMINEQIRNAFTNNEYGETNKKNEEKEYDPEDDYKELRKK